MLGEFVASLVPYAIVAWLLLLILLLLPLRRNYRISTTRIVPASMDWIWGVYRTNLDDPDSAALHDTVVEVTEIPGDPDTVELVLDLSGGHRTNLVTAREIVLEENLPERMTMRTVALGDKEFPFGPESRESLILSAHPQGTKTTIEWHGETATLWDFIGIWRTLRRFLRRMDQLSRHRADPSAPSAQPAVPRRKLWTSLGLSALALGSFALWLGWLGALLLAGCLILHEFGHWIAMRLTGHPAPRIMLIPFLGGVAVGNHPHRTLFDDAFCSLMGAGFSLVPCLAFLLAGYALSPYEMTLGWIDYLDGDPGAMFTASFIAVAVAVLLAFLNLFQLLPVMPLDGGQVLRALLQSFSVKWARRILIAITAGAFLLFLADGDYIIAAICVIGALVMWHSAAIPLKSRPMGAAGLVTIGTGYLLTVGIYITVIGYVGWLFGFDFVALLSGEPF